MSKNIIVLGAGYGGVAAAKELNKLLKKEPDATITLIDKNPFHTLLTEIHEVAGNRIEEEGVQVNLDRLFAATKVNVVQDVIDNIDFDNKVLESDQHEYSYDYLIMGTGSTPATFGVEGVLENSFTLWSIEDAEKIRDHIYDMFQEASMTKDPELRKEILSFIICGAGFTGVELVGEFIEWFDSLSEKYGIDQKEIEIYLCEGLPQILPNLQNEDSKLKARKYMEDNGVNVKTGSFVTKIEPNKLTLGSGEEIKSKTIIWTCGVQACGFAQASGLDKMDRGGRINVNEYLQTLDHPEVYAIGDNAAAPDGEGNILPALVESAMQTGECAAKNIVADMKGTPKEKMKANLHGVLVSVGGNFAVAEVAGMKLKGRFAMFMKHMVNMHYLFDIGGIKEGFGLILKYLDEQGSPKGFVSQTFDHLTQRTRTLWIVLLRMFFGVLWLYEGYSKVRDGWLAVGDKLVAGASASPIGDYAVGWYVTIMENTAFKAPLFFQRVITLTMIAIGLSLIFGLFATLSALVSTGLSINFLLSGQYPLIGEFPGHFNPLFFFLFASIALIRSGRAFGLDYYVLPWLKNAIWNRPESKKDDLKKVVQE